MESNIGYFEIEDPVKSFEENLDRITVTDDV